MTTLAQRWIQTFSAHSHVQEELVDRLREIAGCAEDELPWEDTAVDPCDWDGTAVELTGARAGFEFTPEQLLRVWALGFDVVDIEYGPAKYKRWLKDPAQCDRHGPMVKNGRHDTIAEKG